MDRLTPEQLVFRFDIWRKLHSHWLPDQADRQLVELRDQLQSLSQEAVRDEVLEEAATMCLDVGEQEMIRTGRSQVARTYQIGCENCHDAIVALKREPNAGAQASGSSEHTMVSANPAPAAPAGEAYARDLLRKLRRWLLEINHGYPEVKAYPMNKETELGLFLEEVAAYLERPAPAAPDVASMVKRLRACCIDYDGSEEVDGAPPVIVPSCAELRQAASLLERLSK